MLKTYLKSLVQQPYVYSPLSSPRSIRVLNLHNASVVPLDADRIEFTVEERSLDSPGDYWALSYVCGDPQPVADVRVNERFFGVGKNLDAALRHVWLHFAASKGGTLWANKQSPTDPIVTDLEQEEEEEEPRTLCLWIDAISIGQGDADEKGRQVRLMKEIFEKAQRVVCWLGEQDDDFCAGYEKLRDMSDWFNEVQTKLAAQDVNKYLMDNIAHSGLITYTADGRPDLQAWKALGNFFDRPYWRRTWIMQECTTQAPTTFLCGTIAIASRTFEIAEVVFLGCFINKGLESLQAVTGIEQIMKRTAFKRFRNGSLPGGGKRGDAVTLVEVMEKLRGLDATNPRDKVYACIPVAADAAQLPIHYSVSVAQVYVDFVRFQTAKDGNLDVLGFVGKSIRPPPGLPSWAPDWSTYSRRSPFAKVFVGDDEDEEHTMKKLPVYHADAFCRQSDQVGEMDIRSNQLHLKGVFVDKIQVVGEKMGSAPLFDVGAEYSWASLCRNGKGIYTPTGETMLTAYFRVLVADTCSKDGKIVSRASQVEWPHELGSGDDLRETMSRTGTAGSRRLGNMKNMTTKRTLAVTQAGYIGLVPSYAQVGDEIWVLVRGQLLYVLRDTARRDVEAESRIHEFLGEAYVHGLMDGEAGDLKREVEGVILE